MRQAEPQVREPTQADAARCPQAAGQGTFSLASLSATTFRSYARMAVSLDPRPVVLAGANGAGKTNLVEAVSLLSPGRGLRRASAEEIARQEGPAWRVEARVAAPGGPREIVIAWSAPLGRRVEIDGKAATQAALGDVLRVLWLTPAMDRLWLEAASERRRFLDRLTLSLVPSHAEAVLGYEKALRERNRLIRDGVRDPGWYAALERQMARSGAAVSANRRLALERLAAARLAGPFPNADLALVTEAPVGEAALAVALREGRARDFAAGRSLTGPHRDDLAALHTGKAMPARLCSTGEQKALLLSITLANARAVAEAVGAAPVLILDEVAAHLDPERREALFAQVVALGAQAWMTGTDAALFAPLGARAQRFLVCETEQGSRLRAVEAAWEQRPPPRVRSAWGQADEVRAMSEQENPDEVPPEAPGAGENICRKCGGSGRIGDEACPECGGTGKIGTPIGGA